MDVLATDKLGKLALTQEGCKARDEYVLRQAKEANIPVAIVMGGGYSENIEDVVEAHCNTFRLAQQIFLINLTDWELWILLFIKLNIYNANNAVIPCQPTRTPSSVKISRIS